MVSLVLVLLGIAFVPVQLHNRDMKFFRAAIALLMVTGMGVVSATPVYSDLWDTSNGASYVSSTGIMGGAFNGMGMFGQSLTQYEPGTTFFRDGMPQDTVHSITWTTPVIVSGIGSFNLVAGGDNNAQRSIDRFVLWAGTSASNLQVIFDSGGVGFTAYGTEYSHSVTALVPDASFFKADFYQGGSTSFSGPRVIELDGFGPVASTPEPAPVAVLAAGLGVLLFARRRNRRAY